MRSSQEGFYGYIYVFLRMQENMSNSVLAFMWSERQVEEVDGKKLVAYPEMDNLLEMRGNSNLYKAFYRKLVAATMGRHGWNIAMAKQDGCELVTASNEAFTLLVVKNYYDCWLDYLEMMERDGLTHIELLTAADPTWKPTASEK